ncbi:hypothetical protein MTR67_049496 [Solanum verrucosum]|uniref:Uncharacterized protein n=1 Tax=Solanum verrucosum TaxID=315347 RepID=A0AAF0V3J4_SOLVR|nr:hypothetical protein MTR67_049496 [Solanum verrucosum]
MFSLKSCRLKYLHHRSRWRIHLMIKANGALNNNINYVVLIIRLTANGTYSSDGTQRILTRLGAHLGSEKFRRSLCSSQEVKAIELCM